MCTPPPPAPLTPITSHNPLADQPLQRFLSWASKEVYWDRFGKFWECFMFPFNNSRYYRYWRSSHYLLQRQLPSSRCASSSLALHVQHRFRFFCTGTFFPPSLLGSISCSLFSSVFLQLFPCAVNSVSVSKHLERLLSPLILQSTWSLKDSFPRSRFDSLPFEVSSSALFIEITALLSSDFSFLCNSE